MKFREYITEGLFGEKKSKWDDIDTSYFNKRRFKKGDRVGYTGFERKVDDRVKTQPGFIKKYSGEELVDEIYFDKPRKIDTWTVDFGKGVIVDVSGNNLIKV